MCDCPCCGCITVSTGTVKIVEKCGAFQKIAKPGLNCIVPCIGECPAGTVSMRLQQMEVTCDTKTKDNVFVVIKVAVQYHVVSEDSKIHDAHYRLTNPTKQIESYVFDVVRSSVPKIDLDDVFTTKEEIAHSIQEQLCKSMESFGFAILASPITDINPDDQVKRAMNEINKQRRLRVAAEDEGEAVKIRAIKEAEAVASRTEIQAKADAEAKYLAGQGIARQRQVRAARAEPARRPPGSTSTTSLSTTLHLHPLTLTPSSSGDHGGPARVGQRVQVGGGRRRREGGDGPDDRHAVLRHDARRRRAVEVERGLPQPLARRPRGPGAGGAEGLHGGAPVERADGPLGRRQAPREHRSRVGAVVVRPLLRI